LINYPVSSQPGGATSPGVAAVANDPLGQQGKVYQETVCPTCNNSTGSSTGDWTYIFNDQSQLSYWGNNGQADWIHFKVMFPGNGAYRNTSGEWNWLFEAHDNNDYQNFSNVCEDNTGLTVVQYSGDPYPYLGLRVDGGLDSCPFDDGSDVWTYDSANPLQYNHWYDIVFHIIWSPSSTTGLFEWWKDGQQMMSRHMGTLWLRPDGSTDHVSLMLNNYRLQASWNSTVYYSKTLVGPTQASVGF
jgi:hypothetical protein